MNKPPTLREIRIAHDLIKDYIHWTPVHTSRSLNDLVGRELFFKCENLQKAGSFKIRGAAKAVFCLSDEQAERGVATHSSGNFAQALALAAGWRGIPAYLVMPENAPSVKKEAVAGYGGQITFCRPTLPAREEGLARVVQQTGATFLHPYNNYDVIAGQGTATLELLTDVPDLDCVIAPVGGGGLLSGTALAAKGISAQITVLAGEPKGADDAFRSLQAGEIIPSVNPQTIADGLLTSLGDKTFPIIQQHVSEIITVSEESIIYALRLLWERLKLVVEPSSAVVLAALLDRKADLPWPRIGVILSGGNVATEKLFK